VDNAAGAGIMLDGSTAAAYVGNNRIHGQGGGMFAGVNLSSEDGVVGDNVVHANTISGIGSRGISLDGSAGGSITGNVCSENLLAAGSAEDFVAGASQLWVGAGADDNLFHANSLGGGGEAAVDVAGDRNYFVANQHFGSYQGWTSEAQNGLWRFQADSADNMVVDPGPDGLDTTDQFLDLGTGSELHAD